MNFMKYSNENQINIIPKEEFEQLIHEVFNIIASNLSKSLGPLGSSATILDGMLTEATKDGYAILNKYKFHNRYKRFIYNLIKAPCTKMNNTVGDGTTTAIALTNAIFNSYKESKSQLESVYRLPRQFIKAWDEVIEDIISYIKDNARMISPDDYDSIYNIAYVTSNGDHEVSANIASIYKEAKFPNIKQKDSPTNKSYIKKVKGYEFPTNAIDVVFVKNEDLTAEENNVFTIIVDHKVESDFMNKVLIPMNEVMRAMNKKVIIMTPSYDEYMLESVIKNYVNYEMNKHKYVNMILTQFKLSDLYKNQLNDLSVITGGKIVTQDTVKLLLTEVENTSVDTIVDNIINKYYDEDEEKSNSLSIIGNADKVMLSCKNGSLFEVNNIENNEDYRNTLTIATNELNTIIQTIDYEKQSFASKIYEAQSRINQLRMNNYVYYIGADSVLQKQIIWDSIEDVIKCLKSSIKHGIVPGCQLTIIHAITKLYDGYEKENEVLKKMISKIIYNSIIIVYMKVLTGPDNMGMFKLIENWNNPMAFIDENENLDNIDSNEFIQNHIEKVHEKAMNKCREIIDESIKVNKVFDLETLEYNENIITSAETDMMVLTVASELIKILISGNQCIFLDSEINSSHQEIVEM